MRFRYAVAKLLDFDRGDLKEEPGPMSLVGRAHLASLRTAGAGQPRLRAKIALVREIYRRDYTEEAVGDLYRFIDWVMDLPPDHPAGVVGPGEREISPHRLVVVGERPGHVPGRDPGRGAVEVGLGPGSRGPRVATSP